MKKERREDARPRRAGTKRQMLYVQVHYGKAGTENFGPFCRRDAERLGAMMRIHNRVFEFIPAAV